MSLWKADVHWSDCGIHDHRLFVAKTVLKPVFTPVANDLAQPCADGCDTFPEMRHGGRVEGSRHNVRGTTHEVLISGRITNGIDQVNVGKSGGLLNELSTIKESEGFARSAKWRRKNVTIRGFQLGPW
ncbi:hypothetical protein JOC27_001226 [Sporolactobacillus spathodeae]|uniref:Uncharacterized protein n=1 Tax=Sporolactobacillus spathodeae TaxID=1465502 RepID=A0ABS2Q847_9BACL|nr:hypothetical protein [Sporolactobacillus spathodeae]